MSRAGTKSPKSKRRAAAPQAVAYSLWSVPQEAWEQLPKLPARLRLTEAQRASAEKKAKERARPFETPISAEALNRNV